MLRNRRRVIVRCRCNPNDDSEEIDFIGIQKLFDSKNTFGQKLFWFLALATSISICVWQVYLCLEKFFSGPVGTSVHIEVFNQFTFPAFSLCPQVNQFGAEMLPVAKEYCSQIDECRPWDDKARLHFPYEKLNTNLAEMWSLKDVKARKMRSNCIYAVDPNKCNPVENVEYKDHVVDVMNGRCLTFYSGTEWYYSHSAARTWWIEGLSTNSSLQRYPQGHIDVYVHASSIPYKLMIADQNTDKQRDNDILITMTEFRYLNQSRRPCTTEDQVTECRNKCVDEMFNTMHATCRSPFLTRSNLPYCKNQFELNNLEKQLTTLQLFIDKCKCYRACKSFTYITTRASYDNEKNKKEDVATIGLVMAENIKQIISEFYSYPFMSLLSDLGGSIGLFLGISLFTFLELIYIGGSKLFKSAKLRF